MNTRNAKAVRRRAMWVLLALFALCLAVLAGLGSLRISPQPWTPSAMPESGSYGPNDKLSASRRLLEGVGVGPGDIAVSADGAFFTGYEDGRIVRFSPDGAWSVLANTEGRPLGMQLNADGELIVADALRGLLSVSMDGAVSVLVDQVDGVSLNFANNLDIASDGTVWFSNASQRFAWGENIYDILEASASGRLLSYDPRSRQAKVRLEGLYFANGVVLDPEERYVLVSETGAAGIRRLWLSGERSGEVDWFVQGLPGLPDNMSFDGAGAFWVALIAVRSPSLEALADRPWLRLFVAGLPYDWLSTTDPPHGLVLRIGLDGSVREYFHDISGRCATLTSATPVGDTLYMGSLTMSALCALKLGAR